MGFWDFCSGNIFRRTNWTLYHLFKTVFLVALISKKWRWKNYRSWGKEKCFWCRAGCARPLSPEVFSCPSSLSSLSSSSFFCFNIFRYTLLLFDFHNFNSCFFMFCFFQLITHRLSGQEWTWCFHVLSCLSFPPCDPSHNIVWVDQSTRENEHLQWLQCSDLLFSFQNYQEVCRK